MNNPVVGVTIGATILGLAAVGGLTFCTYKATKYRKNVKIKDFSIEDPGSNLILNYLRGQRTLFKSIVATGATTLTAVILGGTVLKYNL